MTQQNLVERNRRNARKSTGPSTAEGKAVSRYNALRHGLAGAGLVVLGERQEELDKLRSGFEAALAPADAVERFLVESVVTAVWRLCRVRRVEAGIFEAAVATAEVNATECKARDCISFPPSEMDELLAALTPNPRPPTVLRPEEHAHWTREAERFRDALQTPVSAQVAVFRQEEGAGPLANLARYEAHLWRRFTEALRELQRYRASRAGATE